MSAFKLSCPHCKQHLEAPEDMLGETIECPVCKGAVRLPAPQSFQPDESPKTDVESGTVPRERKIEVPAHPHPAVRVLGGKTDNGRMIFLISCFKSSNMDLEIDTGGHQWKDFRVQVLDETHDLMEGDEEISKTHNKLTIRKDRPGSAVYLVTLVCDGTRLGAPNR